jgi:WD repeat-containing protein 48
VNIDEPKFPRLAVTSNAADQSPFLPSSPQAAQFNGPFTAPPSSNPQSDYFSGAHHTVVRRESSVQLPPPAALPTSPTSPTSGNFMNRLKNLSVKAKLSRVPINELPSNELLAPTTSTTSISPSITPTEETTQQQQQPSPQATQSTTPNGETKPAEDSKLKDIEESKSESYTPPHLEDFPPLEIPSSTMIIVAEESAEASTGIDLYRGTVGSVGEDAGTIIDVAPSWLLSYLLYVSYILNHISLRILNFFL